jgi:hypothetical protein
MRRAVWLTAVALVVVGCGERAEPQAQPQPPPAESEPAEDGAAELPGATCNTVNEGNPANLPDFVDVETDSSDGVDRITFRFEPQPNAPAKPPWHFVDFADELVTEGEGKPVRVAGESFVMVSFQAIGTDLSSETPVKVYTGPERFSPEYPTLREAVMLGDFEAQVSWGLGLSERACYRVDAGPDHLTLEFPSA